MDKPVSHIAEVHQRLLIAAEAAKCELTGIPTCHVSCPFLKTDDGDILPLAMALTRLEFEELTRDLVDKLLGPVGQALRDASIECRNIGKNHPRWRCKQDAYGTAGCGRFCRD